MNRRRLEARNQDGPADRNAVLDALMPTNPLMQGPWADCLSWALGNPETLAAFREETGNNWTPGRTGIEIMIDRATGADAAFIEQFARWVNRNIWGEVDGRAANGDEPNGTGDVIADAARA